MNNQQKSWKDRVPPDGHMPASYEVQVCDEGNKTIAVQMLDKSGIDYKISARKGQFFIQTADMETFTKVKNVLNQTLNMSKEAAHLGFPPEVTPMGTNTRAEVGPTTVAVAPDVKEDTFQKVVDTMPDMVKTILEKHPDWKNGVSGEGVIKLIVDSYELGVRLSEDKQLTADEEHKMEEAFEAAGCDQHQYEVWVMAWTAAKASK